MLGAKPAYCPCPMVSRILRSVYKGGTATGEGRLGPSSPGTELYNIDRKTAGCFIYLFCFLLRTCVDYFFFKNILAVFLQFLNWLVVLGGCCF